MAYGRPAPRSTGWHRRLRESERNSCLEFRHLRRHRLVIGRGPPAADHAQVGPGTGRRKMTDRRKRRRVYNKPFEEDAVEENGNSNRWNPYTFRSAVARTRALDVVPGWRIGPNNQQPTSRGAEGGTRSHYGLVGRTRCHFPGHSRCKLDTDSGRNQMRVRQCRAARARMNGPRSIGRVARFHGSVRP